MKLILAVMTVLGSACIVCGEDIQYKTAYVDKMSTECYWENGQQKCRNVVARELVSVPVPAETGEVLSSVGIMQAFSGNNVGYRSLTPIRNFIVNSQIRPLARVAGVVRTFFSRFRR